MWHDKILVTRYVDDALRVDQAERRLIDGRRGGGGGLAAVGEGRRQPGRSQVRRRLLLLLLLPRVRLLLEGLHLEMGANQDSVFPMIPVN